MLSALLLLSLLPTCPTEGYVSSDFGYRKHPIQRRRKFHKGIDIAAPTGQPVVAPWPGIVVRSRYKRKGYGKYVVVQHGPLKLLYAHLSHRNVRSGDTVEAGDLIGAVGQTGLATGPHLHLGAYGEDGWTDPSVVMVLCQMRTN